LRFQKTILFNSEINFEALISVIIPSFNRAGIVERAIKSVLIQEFQDWELIIVDDGSTDDTKEKLLPFLSHSQISYFHQPNAGVSAARNFGAIKAKGEWLIFLDSDDEFTNDALNYFSKAMSQNKEIQVVIAGYEIKSGENISTHIPDQSAYHPALSGGFMIARDLFLNLGGYDEALKFSENTELFHRVSISKVPIQSISGITLRYHENEAGGSKNLFEKNNAIVYILTKHEDTLSNEVKRLYHQIMGVNYLRFRDFESARVHLWKAYLFDLMELNTLGRFFIACLPPLATRLYKENP